MLSVTWNAKIGPCAGGGESLSVGRREMGGEKEREDERHDERADGALAMEEFEAEIGQGEQPAEERHRAVKIVIRDGVDAAGAFEEREIVGDQAESEEDRAEAAGDFAARAQEADCTSRGSRRRPAIVRNRKR